MTCTHERTPGLVEGSFETQKSYCKKCGVKIIRIKGAAAWSQWETAELNMTVADFNFI
jgi:hypothetical protein